jgi:hypothetical protein
VTTAQTATLTAAAAGTSATYALQLNAWIPGLTLGASNVAFGSVIENTTAAQTVTLTSSGTAPLTISAGSVNGTAFSMSGITFPLTLNPAQTATLNLQFAPTTTGSMTGTVTITSNAASGGTASILLSGTGAAPSYQVDLSWYAPTSSTDPVVSYNVYRATGSGTFALLNTLPILLPSWTDASVQAGLTYSYEVTSVDAFGIESVPSTSTVVAIP